MEYWRRVWREGIAPQLTVYELSGLAHAIASDDPKLIQGATTSPPAFGAFLKLQCEAACAIGYCGWLGDEPRTVGEVEAFFQRVCDGADAAMEAPAALRYFLNWVDDTPRDEMRRQLLAEVHVALSARAIRHADGEPVVADPFLSADEA